MTNELTPIAAVRIAVEQIKRCAESKGSIEEMQDLVRVLLTGYHFNSPRFLPGSRFYRARVTPAANPPLNISQISVPPKAFCRSNQRCNRPGEPMFYCSDHPSAPLAEVGAKAGDHVVISEWSTTKHLWVMQVGYSESSFEKLGARRPCPPSWVNTPESTPLDHEHHQSEVNKYLADLFTEKIPEGSEHLYAPSIAITEKMLSFKTRDDKKLFDDPDMKVEGIMYPTIALQASCET